MNPPHCILVVDDEPPMLRYMQTLLELGDYRVETALSGQEALKRVQKDPPPDLVLLDIVMPELNGLETLKCMREVRPSLKVAMLSCVSDSRTVVDAMRLGAKDFLPKPFQKPELDSLIARCFDSPRSDGDGSDAPVHVEEVGDEVFFLAAHPLMRKIREQVELVARVDVPILILGESGTGKEVLARLVHKLSHRNERSFLKVNCAALPGDLLESELFGYEPGAFTGATREKPGKFELCDGGTMLLDEIGEMPVGLQAKLLQVLQDHEFSRLGGRTTIRVDVRILAATNVDMQKALANKKLRPDLYYRLNAFTIEVPPLRERRGEIPLLLRHFMTRLSSKLGREPLPISPGLQQAALRHDWSGNLRELENFIKRYLILRDEAQAVKELAARPREINVTTHLLAAAHAAPAGDLKSLVRSLKDEAEFQAISQTLERTSWNRKEAARLLNLSYKALLNKIRRFGLENHGPRDPHNS